MLERTHREKSIERQRLKRNIRPLQNTYIKKLIIYTRNSRLPIDIESIPTSRLKHREKHREIVLESTGKLREDPSDPTQILERS